MHSATQPSFRAERPIPPFEPDTDSLRKLITEAGMRFTLARLKVLKTLYLASSQPLAQEDGVAGRALHQQLISAGEPLTLVSVRDVLRRMSSKGIVQSLAEDRYCISGSTLKRLEQGVAG